MSDTDEFPGRLNSDLDELEAFDAMRLYLEGYWRRGGKGADDLAVLLGSINRSDGAPLDVAQWDDWLDAVSKVRRERQRR